jgi:hypothetical protein
MLVHDEYRTGKSSVTNDDHNKKAEDNIHANRLVTSNALHEIREVSKLLINDIVKERVEYCKLCVMGTKNVD